ncbi:MAG: uroporphyrinogen-III synthase [Nitriliruptoraceae bacterium]
MAGGPLAGRRVLVARAAGQAAPLSERIAALGGEPVEAPVLEIRAGDRDGLMAAVRAVAGAQVAVVAITSPNGVDALAEALAGAGLPADALQQAEMLACVGPGTAARLRSRLAMTPDLVPPRATTRSLGEAIPSGTGRALLPRADIASAELPDLLAAKGYEVEEVVAYRVGRPTALPEEVLDDLAQGRIDLVALGSPSTARNLVSLLADRPWSARVVSIGPVTSAACRALGLDVAAEADPHDLDGLVGALVAAVD